MLRAAIVGVFVLDSAIASASPREEGAHFGAGLTGGVVHYGGDCDGCDVGPGVGGHLRLGGLLGDNRRFAVLLEAVLMQSWHDGGKRMHAAGTLGVAFWLEERLSLSLGVGYAAADSGTDDNLVGSGPAVIGTIGYDLHHWQAKALVARVVLASADGDQGIATQATLTIGFDVFGFSSDP